MPSKKTDWLLLKKTLDKHGQDISEIWGQINEENASIISKLKYHNKPLFEYLLTNKHYYDANTISSYISLFNEKNINLIYEEHHRNYQEILKILCMDKMILMYEKYQKEACAGPTDTETTDNVTTDTETTDTETDNAISDFNHTYRIIISERYKDILLDHPPNNLILELVKEFNFLTHQNMDNFNIYLMKNKQIYPINKFNDIYIKYKKIIPLIHRLINEYYLEYIKYQIKTINDAINNSFIILEHYDNLKKCIEILPQKYLDYHYQDKFGNNIIMYLATLPNLLEPMNNLGNNIMVITNVIYKSFFDKINTSNNFPLDLQNSDNNTVFHLIALNENEIFLEILLDFFGNNDDYEYVYDQMNRRLVELLAIENNEHDTIFDILIVKNNYSMLNKIINYAQDRVCDELVKKIIEESVITDKIPDTNHNFTKIYLEAINCLLNNIFLTKNKIIYDLNDYAISMEKIFKLIKKCCDKTNIQQNYYLEWLLISIMNNEIELFKNILTKFISNKQSLNKIIGSTAEPIIMTAIRYQKMAFIQILLDQHIDLSVCDNTNKNIIIVALETQNLFIIELIRDYIINTNSNHDMLIVMNNYIDLLREHAIFDIFSIPKTVCKIFRSTEYLVNYLIQYSVQYYTKYWSK